MTMQVRYYHEKPISKIFGNFNINIGKEKFYHKIKKAIQYGKEYHMDRVILLIFHRQEFTNDELKWLNEKSINNFTKKQCVLKEETSKIYKLEIIL